MKDVAQASRMTCYLLSISHLRHIEFALLIVSIPSVNFHLGWSLSSFAASALAAWIMDPVHPAIPGTSTELQSCYEFSIEFWEGFKAIAPSVAVSETFGTL